MRLLIVLALSANAWAVNPAVVKLVHLDSGSIGDEQYHNYQVHCGNSQQANMVRFRSENYSHASRRETERYCVGGQTTYTECSWHKLTTASNACGTTRRGK